MYKKVTAYLERWNMVSAGDRVCVGFSGGADSMALLMCLWEYGKANQVVVYALHVNHGIRGEEADRDQRVCEEFCEDRGIELRVCYADVPALAREEGSGEEETGRKARYGFFEEELAAGRASKIALAHHRNDQAETMLFHLMRGSGLKGLRGMEAVRGAYIRPLLCVERGEIEKWLKAKGVCWAEDGSNRKLIYTRNRIRYQVLGPMEEILPGSAGQMAKAAERLWEIEDYLERECRRWREDCVRAAEGRFDICIRCFEKLHPAMQKLLVLQLLEELSGGARDLQEVHAKMVAGLLRAKRGSRVMLPGGVTAVLGYENIRLQRGYGSLDTWEPVACSPGERREFGGEIFLFSLRDRDFFEEIPVNCYTKWFDYDKIKNDLMLRTRLSGDYLEAAKGVKKKLNRYLIDEKVPREMRDRQILLADGSHIIWVVGMRISGHYKVTDKTRRILEVQKC